MPGAPALAKTEASPRLEVRDFRLLVAVAEEGSLTLAGNRLNVTQPALSRHLKSLEDRLGTPLFTRTGTRLRLAPPGERLLRHARELLEHLARVEQDLNDVGDSPSAHVRVGTECLTAYHWLPRILSRYTAQHPRVRVEIAFEVAGKPLKPLLDGDIDVALVSEGWRGRGLAITQLFTDEFVALVAPGHPWSARAYVEPGDFAGTCLLLVVPASHSTVVQRFLNPAGIKPAQIIDVQLMGAVSGLVAGQFGVGVLPSWTIAPDLRAGRVVAVRLGRTGLRRVWVAATTKSRLREPYVRDFVGLIAAGGPAAGFMPVKPLDE